MPRTGVCGRLRPSFSMRQARPFENGRAFRRAVQGSSGALGHEPLEMVVAVGVVPDGRAVAR